jgi:hypothetical protein
MELLQVSKVITTSEEGLKYSQREAAIKREWEERQGKVWWK